MAKDTYDVGYKKPPEKAQFKKGKSGNPSGRPKGSKNKKAFAPLDNGNVFEFQKQIVDAGYEEIQVVKDGYAVSMSKIDALLAQLYNKAMNGNLGAAKVILQYTNKSLFELGEAAHRVRNLTIKMRNAEREKIFTPEPKPNTHGAYLKRIHELFSSNFALREMHGEENVPFILETEPKTEYEWPRFNKNMRKEYLSSGDEPCDLDIVEQPSILLMH